MNGLAIYEFLWNYVTPVGMVLMFVLGIYAFGIEALTAHRRAKREREQQIH